MIVSSSNSRIVILNYNKFNDVGLKEKSDQLS